MDSLKRIKDKHELFRLRNGCKKWCIENIIPDIGKPFFIHSPKENTYYPTEVKEYTDWGILEGYINEGNCYLLEE